MVTEIKDAAGNKTEIAPLNLEESINSDNPADTEEPIEPDNPEEPEKPEEPEEPEEPVIRYEMELPEPGGENGYYVEKPEVLIRHVSKRGVTKYIFTDSDGNSAEGVLSEEGSEARIEREQFREGSNNLHVWMEEEDGGKKADDYEFVREFKVDTIAPLIELSAPKGFEAWYQKGTVLTAAGNDGERGSQIQRISCYAGEKLLGNTGQSIQKFSVEQASSGGNGVAVAAEAVDWAGNKSSVSRKLYIDNTPPKINIQGIENYMITSRPLDIRYEITEDNRLKETSVSVKCEGDDGTEKEIQADEWKDTVLGKDSGIRLEEDGIYKMKVRAQDMAGFTKEEGAQVIIDKKNPVIRYVDSLDGKYLKEFQWNYLLQDLIWDFTTYTYEITLDGKPYHMGEKITKEGGHILKVKACDAAGNEALAMASFVIDRTPPEIIYMGVENEGNYEEACTFKIVLKDKEDEIEEIKIAGERQELNSNSKAYQFTVEEKGACSVSVKAHDKAGNNVESKIIFSVREKAGVVEKIINPIKKSIEKNLMQTGKKERHEQKTGNRGIWIMGAALFILALAGGVWYIIRKRKLL